MLCRNERRERERERERERDCSPLTRRLTEPGLFIFEGSNPASYGGKDLAEREGFEPSKGF